MRTRWQRRLPTVAFAVVTLTTSPAAADVEGTAPARVANWRLFGAHSATGAALMIPGPLQAEVNSVMLSSASADMLDTPFDADVVAAFLFWSGSSPRSNRSGPPDPPDRDADFTVADGTFYNDLSVDTDTTGFGDCFTADALGGFYYCRRDVTDIVRAQGAGNVNGVYTVGDVAADPGTLDAADAQRINAQAKYAAWSLILVWQSSTETVRRDVVLYDGFLRLDETTAAAGIHTFTIGDFVVGSPPLGRLTVFGMEGDRQLGVPPQDSTGCPNCWDFISFQAASAAGATELSNGANPAHNSFNSSWDTSVDIDTYYLDGLISTGDTSAAITLGSGDGIVDAANNQGNGESFMAGWVIMTIDTLTPNFAGTQTRKTVVPVTAGPGQRLFYLIDVVNEGSAGATNVIVQDGIPAGTEYVPGSTRIDGVPVPDDAGGTSPLVAGLNIGSVPALANGDHTRQVTFEVRVDPAACGGNVVNSATVDSDETDPVAVGPVTTNIVSTVLEPPTKSVSLISAPPFGPGAAFSYTIDVVNNGPQDAGGVTIEDPLPANVVVTSVFATSGTWSLANNTLAVADMTVPSGGSAQVVVVARVMSVAELVGSGIAEDDINGLLISNQATVSGGCTPDQLTDDPDVPGFQPTESTLTYAPVLDTSSKAVSDVNGSPLEPDDSLLYTITVTNTGNRVAEVIVTDSIPANTTYVSGSTRVDGVAVPDAGGGVCPLVGGLSLGSVPYVGDNDRVITFEVVVDTLVANGAVIQNSADLSVPVAPDADTTVISPPLTVFAGPEFSTSAKSVADTQAPLGVFEPGEQVVYTIEVTNSGNRPATGVTVTDVLAPQLVFVSANRGGSLSGNTVSWTLGAVPRDTTVSLTLRARIVSPLDNGTLISNTATIASNELPDFVTPAATFVVVSAPLLRVEKIDDHPSLPPRPGDPVAYRIRIWNEGTASARDIVVTDPVDPSLANAAAPTGQVSGGLATWDAGSNPLLAQLDPGVGNAIDLVLDATIRFPLADGTEIVNQATVTPAGFPPVLSDDPDDSTGAADPTRFTIVSQATLAVSKIVEDLTPGTPPLPGDRVRYTLTLSAGGDAPLGNVVVTDPIDPWLENADASTTAGSIVAGVATWSPATGNGALGLLEPGDIVELVLEADIRPGTPNGTVVTNQATALSAGLTGLVLSDDPAVPGATDPTVFTVVSTPVLDLTKTVALFGDDDPDFNPGDEVEYTLTLTNVGTGATTDPVIVDTFASNLTIVDADGGSVSGNTISWSTAPSSLFPGGQIIVRPRLRIASPLDDGTVISNQGRASSVELPDPELSDDPSLPGTDDPTVFTVSSAPDFSATTKTISDLTGDPLVTRPGDLLEFTIEVRNQGDSDADDVVVRDPMPADVAVTVPANGRADGGSIVWDSTTEPALVRVPAGATVTLVFTATVDAPLPNGTLVSNQAFIESAEVTTPVPSDDPATVAVDDPTVVTIVSAADLGGSTKLVSDLAGLPIATARPNDVVRYTLAITNRGDATAVNVVVTDAVDASLAVVAAPGGSVAGATITWDSSGVPALAAVLPNDVVLLTFDAQLNTPLDDGLTIVNQGSITAEDVAEPVLTDADPATLPKEETTLTVVSSANLSESIKQFIDPVSGSVLTQARPGNTLRILLTLRNSGDAIAHAVQVEDVLDTTLLTDIVVRDGGTLDGATARWTVPQVAPGAAGEVVLRVDARLRTPLDPTTLVNQAFLGVGALPTIPTDDPGQPGNADPTVLDIISSADLSGSTKDVVAASGREVGPGEVYTYPIAVTNTGDGNAHNVLVTDALPPELEFVSATGGGGYDGTGHTVAWSIPMVSGGSETTVSVTVRVGALIPNGTAIDNQAQLSADALPPELTDDPLVATPDTPTRVTVVATASFATFEKTVVNLDETVPGMLQPGDRLRYTLRLRNDGNAVARDVEVRDPIDTSLTDVQPVTPFIQQGGAVLFDASVVPALGLVAPGEEVSLVFDATVAAGVPDGTAIGNQGFATSIDLAAQEASDDPSTATADDPTVIVVRYPALQISKAWVDENGGDPEPGDRISFSITVQNVGSLPAQNVTVTDAVSAGFDQIEAPGADNSGGTLTWRVDEIAAGEAANLSFSARIQPGLANGTRLLNSALASADDVAQVESNRVELLVVATPDFTATTKTVATPNPIVGPGDVLSYEIVVRNDGSGAGTDVRVTDAIDPSLSVVSGSITAGGTLTGDTITWLPGVVEPGGERVVSFAAQVRPNTPNRTVIDNQAFVASPPELPQAAPSDDPATPAPDDPTSVLVISEPDFAETTLTAIDVNGGTLLPGDRIRYELRVVNDGNATSLETTAHLPVPPYTGYVPSSTLLNDAEVPDIGGESLLAVGLSVSSADPAAGPGVLLRDDGAPPDDEHALVVFEVQVDPRALPGTVVSAQATVTALDARPTVSDNPATGSVSGDATVLVVGGGAEIAVAKTVSPAGAVVVDQTLEYTIVVQNAGDTPSPELLLTDPFPENAAYVSGSLARDGLSLTDAADDDPGELLPNGSVVVSLDSIPAGGTSVVTADVRVTAGPWVANQAVVEADGRVWPSDGDPSVPGAQPTISLVDTSAELVGVALEVGDLNGGTVSPLDRLRYTFLVTNDGTRPIADVALYVPRPEQIDSLTITESGPATVVNSDSPTWTVPRLNPGERARVEFEVEVASGAQLGDVIETFGRAETASAQFETDPVRLVVGGGIGSGAIMGRVFRELGQRDGRYSEGTDEALAGFAVLLVPEDRVAQASRGLDFENLAIRSEVVERDGRYYVAGVPPGRYELWALSGEGTVFARSEPLDVSGGTVIARDLPVDPSGIVYQNVDGVALPVGGARVFLVDEDTGLDLPPSALAPGQQGQVTTGQGFYKLDAQSPVLPGVFRIRVEPPAQTLIFPSVVNPPAGATDLAPNGELAVADPEGRVVESDNPDLGSDTTYYLRFRLDGSTDYLNNHIPIDRPAQHIRITKRASRRTARAGEVLTYTVEIVNPLDQGFLVGADGSGGVILVDDLPAGMSWPAGEDRGASVVVRSGGQAGDVYSLATSDVTARTVRFAPLSLPGQSTVVVRYYAVVGIRARGEQVNRARLVGRGGVALSGEATATVRVVEDPIFDQGTVLGRVFCDDGDGQLGPEESGLPGARVFLDNGFYADTDIDGKLHFRGVSPGRHAVKLDLNTVPAASTPTTDVLREIYLSRGLLAKVSFGVRCGWTATRPTHVTLQQLPRPTALVGVDPELPGISLDGRAQPIPLVDAVLTEAGQTPDFASGAGINLAGAGELTWHIQSSGRVPIAQWQISIMAIDGSEVWRVEGEGRPPARVPWLTTEQDLPFAPGVEYLYRIAAVSADRDLGEGRWRRIGLRVGGPERPPSSSTLETLRGKLFRGNTDNPSRELQNRVAALVEKLTAGQPPKIVVEVHVAASRKRSANLLLSQRQAAAIRKLFVAKGYPESEIRALGRGDTQPVMPNVSRKARDLNRRILIKQDLPALRTKPLAPIAYPAYLRIGTRLFEYGSETIEKQVKLDPGDEVVVELREANGRHVRLERTYPFAAAETEAPPTVEIPVAGSLTPSTLRIGDEPVELPLLDSSCELESDPPAVSGKGLTPPARFAIQTASPLRSWQIRVLNPEGTVLRDLTGDGDPPEAVEWDGKNLAGAVVVSQGQYVFRCMFTDIDGNRAVLPMRPLPIAVPTGAASYRRVLDQAMYPESGRLEGPLQPELDRIVAATNASPGARVRVEVHDIPDGGRMEAQIRTARLAAKLKTSLIEAGVPADALEVVAQGAARPVMVGTTRRARGANRRVVIELFAPEQAGGPPIVGTSPERHVRVAGVDMEVGDDGSFSGMVAVDPNTTLVVDIAVGDGRTAIYHVPMFEGRPIDARAAAVVQGFRPGPGQAPIGTRPAVLMETPEPTPQPASSQVGLTGGNGVDAIAGWLPRTPPAVDAPSAPPEVSEPPGPTGDEPIELSEQAPAGARPVTLPIDEAPATAAADLQVWLPDDGAELAGPRLTVRGRADRDNAVTVNGEAVELDELGRFVHTVELPSGEAKLEISAADKGGNVARIERALRVPQGEWFLLAYGDAVAGWGGKLEGMTDDTTIDLKSETYLHGRAVAYFKGRMNGSALFGSSPFEKLRLTGYVDTGKGRDADLARQLVDPEAYYPVYGDAVEEVQDVSSRSKGYLRLEADRSRLTVGNFETQIDGMELFRFRRTYFGGSLDVDHVFLENSPTEVHAFWATGEAGVRHRQLTFQGTGGSMFFLRDADLLEGSERVELVVRDAVSGSRLMTVAQTRNVDYTIDYRDGRLVFAQPVLSVVASGWRLDQNAVRSMDGNPVFVEVEYDYRAAIPEDGETAFAAHVRQTLFDMVTVGGGYVDEDKRDAGGPRYQLYGGELRVKAFEQTRLDAEVAFSRAQDAEHFISYDGGVSYAQVGWPEQADDGGAGRRVRQDTEGWAATLRLSGDIGEIVGRPDWVASEKGDGAGRYLPYTLYAQHQDRGFYSGASVLEQGQTKIGGQVRAQLTEVDSVRLRHDGVWSRLFVAGDEPMVNRQMSFLGYERTGEAWKGGLELGHTYWDDSRRVVNTDNLTAYGEIRVTERLALFGEQEEILRGDDRVVTDVTDRFVTRVGAKYQLAERLWLTANESARWSGSNATQVGLKTKISDDISFYANERLTAGDGRPVSTTVLGGESTAIRGSRSYAEYQLSSMASGRSGRAVFGMDNRWVLTEGLKLSLAYERSQVVGRPTGAIAASLDAGAAVADPQTTGYGSGPLGRDQQFSASGYSSGGVFPVGVSSRDAFSVGLELLRGTTLKAGLRFEMRYDRGDADLGAYDRLVFSGQAGGDWRLDRWLVLLGRVRGASVHNLSFRDEVDTTLGFTEGQYMDVSLGLAYRPVHTDTFEALVKWTRRYHRRPIAADLSQFQLEIADVISAEPVVEIGYGIQAVGKVAVKAFEVQDAELPRIRSSMLLGILRLNYHLTEAFDLGAEYRWLGNFLTEQVEHGALVEVAWIPVRYVSVGVGYNFSHFSDDLLANPTTDSHGAFLRVSGRF